jgi:iron complex outermembrane receptor protein
MTPAATRSRAVAGQALGLLLSVALASAAFAAAGDPGQAQAPDLTNLSIEELMNIDLVVGASKYEQRVTEAPAYVTIVTAADIQAFGYRTLADILGSVPGFYTRYDRSYSFVGVRGFQRPNDYNLRTLLLIDGHRANDNIYNSALIGTEGVLDVDDIDRVEVIRGPSSSIYGASAFFAVINILTRQGRDLNGFEVAGAAGSWDTQSARVNWGTKTAGGAEAYLGGSGLWSGGQDFHYSEFNDPLNNPLSANGGNADGVDQDKTWKAIGKFAWRGFRAEVAQSTRRKVLPAAPYKTLFDDPDNQTLDERGFLDLRYDAPLGSKTTMTAGVYADRYYYRGNYDYPPLAGGLYIEKAYGYTRGAEVQLTARPNPKHTLVAGGELRDHYRQDFYADDAAGLYFDDHRQSSDWGLFVQDQYVPSKRFLFNLGVRHDGYEIFGGSTNPRLAMIVSPTETIVLKFIYGHAFRAPSFQELYYGTGANPDLDPERIRTSEFVYEQYVGRNLRLSGTFFDNEVTDLISLDTTTVLFENASAIDSHGTELALERSWRRGASLRIDYAVQQTIVRATGDRLSNSPRHLAKLHVTLPLAGEKLSANLEALYTGGRTTLAGNDADGYTVLNLTFLSRDLTPGLTLSGSVYNLLDKVYFDPGSSGNTQDTLQQDGRNYRLKLIWKF